MAPAERSGPGDEKVTINLVPVDLGKIDLLVSEGLYGSRTDYIRWAIRRGLEHHDVVLADAVKRLSYGVGFVSMSRKDLERRRDKGQRVDIRVIGGFRLAPDVTPDLADAVIKRLVIRGVFRAPAAVRERLADRMRLDS